MTFDPTNPEHWELRDAEARAKMWREQAEAYKAELAALRAENERLREERDGWADSAATCVEDADLLRAENERLIEVDQRLRESTGKLYTAVLTERDAAIAEAAELRASLADAMRRGFDIAVEHADISTHDGWHVTNPRIEWDVSEKALEAALASLPGIAKVKP